MDTGSFPGVKRPGRGDDHPSPSSSEVKKRVQLYLYTLLGIRGLLWDKLYIIIIIIIGTKILSSKLGVSNISGNGYKLYCRLVRGIHL